jgi:hypothetical protein
MIKNTRVPFIFLAIFFLASCKSPIAPQETGRISFFTLKDTLVNDFHRVVFRFKIENMDSTRQILEWNFSDGRTYKVSLTVQPFYHIFLTPGVYTFSTILRDTVSKQALDSITGTINILEAPPTLSELQKMKYIKIEVYCPVLKNCDTTYHSDPFFYSINVDPFKGPIPYHTVNGILKWDENSLNYSYYYYRLDSARLYEDPLHYIVEAIDVQNFSFQLNGSLNSDNTNLDSTSLSYYYFSEHDNLLRGSNSYSDKEEIKITVGSLPLLKHTSDSLIYQTNDGNISQKIKKMYYNGYPDQGYPYIKNTYTYCGPYWNCAGASASYARVTFYK